MQIKCWNSFLEGNLAINCKSVNELKDLYGTISKSVELGTIKITNCFDNMNFEKMWNEFGDMTCVYRDTLELKLCSLKHINYNKVYVLSYVNIFGKDSISRKKPAKIEPILKEKVEVIKKTLNKDFFVEGKVFIGELSYDSKRTVADFSKEFNDDFNDSMLLLLKGTPDNKIRGIITDIYTNSLGLNTSTSKISIPLDFIDKYLVNIKVI